MEFIYTLPLYVKVRCIIMIKKENVEYYIQLVNSLLKELGITYELEFNARNGYKAIDKKMEHGADTLATGLTTKESYLIACSIYEVLNDIKKEVDKK